MMATQHFDNYCEYRATSEALLHRADKYLDEQLWEAAQAAAQMATAYAAMAASELELSR